MMSDSAVEARDYGIPTVVGAAAATDQISTGQRVTVDGAAGSVVVEAKPATPLCSHVLRYERPIARGVRTGYVP